MRINGYALLLPVALAPLFLMRGGVTDRFQFIDIAAESGVTVPNTFGGKDHKDYILEATGTGAAIFDYDGDGANDIFIANGTTFGKTGLPTFSQLYHNNGKGHFTEVGRQSGLTRTGWAQAACVGDIDNDGHPDLLVTYFGQNALYRNLGNGKFAEITEHAGLSTPGSRWGAGCAFLDYDRDGYLDIFISNYVEFDLASTPKPGSKNGCVWKGIAVSCGPLGLPMGHNALYHNNRDGTFTDVSESAGILKPGGRYGLGVAVADFDNDGWPDIYVACDQTPSLLYHNRHDGTFEELGDRSGVAYDSDGRLQAGMGVAVADFDGNGFLDIAKTNFSGDRPSLYRNEDGVFFEDTSRQAGLGSQQLLGWGIAFLDFDEDGWPDLVMANGHVYPEVDHSQIGETYRQRTLLYRNLGNRRFADITASAGSGFAPPRPARGLATGDLDGDGRPEIVIVNMNERPSILKNLGPRHNWVALTFHGTASNRSAVGARCTVEAGGHTQIGEVMSGGSFYSQNSMTLYFGLGNAEKIDRMEVRWPSGLKQSWQDVLVNRKLVITEGNVAVQTALER
ncbi:MAG TPA: CRTAC1 family protein [Bryobacteraceae bacterium]|nr:CRTAC1 family protein [Bryobacteraceae bacterium]